MQITKNFNLNEFECKCGECEIPRIGVDNIIDLAEELQILRNELDKGTLSLNSGYRCPKQNEEENGVIDSEHIYARAGDVVSEFATPDEVADKVEELVKVGKMKIGGLGRYNTFTHIDIRRDKARWDNREDNG